MKTFKKVVVNTLIVLLFTSHVYFAYQGLLDYDLLNKLGSNSHSLNTWFSIIVYFPVVLFGILFFPIYIIYDFFGENKLQSITPKGIDGQFLMKAIIAFLLLYFLTIIAMILVAIQTS